jgi:hypothetical protein
VDGGDRVHNAVQCKVRNAAGGLRSTHVLQKDSHTPTKHTARSTHNTAYVGIAEAAPGCDVAADVHAGHRADLAEDLLEQCLRNVGENIPCAV